MSERHPRVPGSPFWHGMLCAETHDQIIGRMRDVLDNEYFTLVMANSYSEGSDRFTTVDVEPSQRLTRPIEANGEAGEASIGWGVTEYSLGVSSVAKTQTEGRDGGPHKYVHFTFEPGRIVIDHYAPARYRLQWIFAVEYHEDRS